MDNADFILEVWGLYFMYHSAGIPLMYYTTLV